VSLLAEALERVGFPEGLVHSRHPPWGVGCTVEGPGFRVWGLRIWGAARVWGLRIWGAPVRLEAYRTALCRRVGRKPLHQEVALPKRFGD